MMSQQTDAIALPPLHHTIFTPNKSFGWDVFINSQYIGSADCCAAARRLAEAATTKAIEVDSDGRSYRVWSGRTMLGTFHQSGSDNRWLAAPAYGRCWQRHNTADEAQQAIVAGWKQATAIRSSDQGVALL